MLGCAQWGSLIGFVIINIPIADCRVGYTSSKENIIPVVSIYAVLCCKYIKFG